MIFKKVISISVLILFLILFCGGILIQFLNEDMFKNTEWTPPIFILTAAILCAISQKTRTALLLLIAGLIGFLSEIIGVITSFPYGGYEYTDKLGYKLFDVPLVLVCAWIIVSSFALDLISFLKIKKIFFPFIFASITTYYDLLIDPLMSGPLGYWVWNNEPGGFYGVPLENFFGWFLVSLFISVLPWKTWNNSLFPLIVNLLLPTFFITTSLVNKLYVPGALGMIMVLIYSWIIFRSKKFRPESLS